MLRLIVGYGAILCAVPYLALKVVWVTGGQLGVADRTMMGDASMVALNIVTAGMDVVAMAIALAFTHAWGQRIPAWLVLPPTWVAVGLLVRFVVAVPVTSVAGLLASRAGSTPSGPVQPWVYALVYAEFVGMGIGLSLALVASTREFDGTQCSSRLPRRVAGRDAPNTSATGECRRTDRRRHRRLAPRVGVRSHSRAPRRRCPPNVLVHVVDAVDGATMGAAAVGVLMMVHRLAASRPSGFLWPLHGWAVASCSRGGCGAGGQAYSAIPLWCAAVSVRRPG